MESRTLVRPARFSKNFNWGKFSFVKVLTRNPYLQTLNYYHLKITTKTEKLLLVDRSLTSSRFFGVSIK